MPATLKLDVHLDLLELAVTPVRAGILDQDVVRPAHLKVLVQPLDDRRRAQLRRSCPWRSCPRRSSPWPCRRYADGVQIATTMTAPTTGGSG
jgi:hypothetical protein